MRKVIALGIIAMFCLLAVPVMAEEGGGAVHPPKMSIKARGDMIVVIVAPVGYASSYDSSKTYEVSGTLTTDSGGYVDSYPTKAEYEAAEDTIVLMFGRQALQTYWEGNDISGDEEITVDWVLHENGDSVASGDLTQTVNVFVMTTGGGGDSGNGGSGAKGGSGRGR
jgi:hypothetical protein